MSRESAPFDRVRRAGPSVPGTASITLPHDVALRLAAALVQFSLGSYGIRSLVIKGEGLHRQGIRPPSISADVDVWVDPTRFDEAVMHLGTLGWLRRAEALSWTLFIDHSVTLVHSSWPCDVDLHRSFPGVLEAEAAAFEVLWAARESLTLSEASIDIPGAAHHLVIHALHQLRSGRSATAHAIVVQLADRVERLPLEEREAVRDAAIELGAQAPMAELLERWGVSSPMEERHRPAFVLWEVRRRSDRHTFNWLHAIAFAPWRLKGALLVRAVFPTRSDLEASHPEVPSGIKSRVQLRATRTKRAIKGLPSALAGFARVVRSAPHGSTSVLTASSSAVTIHRSPHGERDPRSVLSPESVPTAPDAEAVAEVRLRRAADFVVERSRTGVYVLDLTRPRSVPVALSLSGFAIWQRAVLDGETRDAVVEGVSQEFDIDPAVIAGDVDAFMQELLRHFPGSTSFSRSDL